MLFIPIYSPIYLNIRPLNPPPPPKLGQFQKFTQRPLFLTPAISARIRTVPKVHLPQNQLVHCFLFLGLVSHSMDLFPQWLPQHLWSGLRCSSPFNAHFLLSLTLKYFISSHFLKQSELMWLQLPSLPVLGFCFVISDEDRRELCSQLDFDLPLAGTLWMISSMQVRHIVALHVLHM